MLRCTHRDTRPTVFLLGDSFIGNYRFDRGQRLEDCLGRHEPGLRVENWAEPGAAPLDFLLQMYRGSLVEGKPQSAIIAISPDKFLARDRNPRFDDNGVNLRWLPWNRIGMELFASLNPSERNVALVQQASVPFYALADLGRAFWIEHVQWPWERQQMRSASPERQKKIFEKSQASARAQDTMRVPDAEEFANLPLAKDAEFTLRSLQEEGVETRVLLLPLGNPDLLNKVCSPKVRADHALIIERMRHWLDAQGVAYIDFNPPEELSHFPGPVWDDAFHPKDPAVFEYMSRRISESLARPSAPSQSIVNSDPLSDASTAGGRQDAGAFTAGN